MRHGNLRAPSSPMKVTDRHLALMNVRTEEELCKLLFEMGAIGGFDNTMLAIVGHRGMRLEDAFLRSNYSPLWRSTYDEQGLAHVDPTVSHCISRSAPLVWSPDIFVTTQQKEMYEAACSYGLRSGITLPIHGANGEFGILCFVRDADSGKPFSDDLAHTLPNLCLLRDIVADTAIGFIKPRGESAIPPTLTPRERECLQWAAAGKSSWETAKILCCSEATINFHITNIRRKFDVGTRREAVVKAIRLGLVRLG